MSVSVSCCGGDLSIFFQEVNGTRLVSRLANFSCPGNENHNRGDERACMLACGSR